MSSRFFTQTLISRIAYTSTRRYPTSIIYSRAAFATQNENKQQVMGKAADLKDQVMGSIKENIGYMFGNKNLENQGKQQRDSVNEVSRENPVRNRTDYEDAEPKKSNVEYISEKVQDAKDQLVAATKEDVNNVAGKAAEVKDKVVGSAKENLDSATNKASSAKDQVVSTVKESIGSATHKGASIKDQVLGTTRENFSTISEKAASTKDQVVKTVKENLGSAAGKATSIKDQVVGSAKENIGYMTGNSTLETEGKIQKNIATDKIPLDKQNIAEKITNAKDQIVSKAKATVENMSGNDPEVDDSKKRLPHTDRINAEKITQKNASSQKRNP